MIHGIIVIINLSDKRQSVLWTNLRWRLLLWQNIEALLPLTLSTEISGGHDISSCQPITPGNPTQMEAIVTVVLVFNVPAHITVTLGIVVVPRCLLKSHHSTGIASI